MLHLFSVIVLDIKYAPGKLNTARGGFRRALLPAKSLETQLTHNIRECL
jgi:hypothetical protein